MAQITTQPENTDCTLYEAIPTTNYSEQYTWVNSKTNYNARPLLRFDFSALGAEEITNATLSLIDYTRNGDPAGRTYDACEVTQSGWVATQATWNVYSTGNAWSTAGGDFTATGKASATVPAAGNWINFDVTTIVTDAQANHSEIAIFIIKDASEDSGASDLGCYYRSAWYGADTSLRPKLVITYASGTTYTLTADVGTYALTGQTAILSKVLNMVCSAGSYALTGVEAGLSRVVRMVCSAGSYVMTGIDAILTYAEAVHLWNNQDKSGVITATNSAKNSASMTNSAKNESTFSNLSKNNLNASNMNKNNSNWLNSSKS